MKHHSFRQTKLLLWCMTGFWTEIALAGGAPMLDFKKPAPAELRKNLTELQYRVTQEEATERPFENEFWDSKQAGIYVDVVSGEPLFSSIDKFDSGTGWPSFTRALVSENVAERKDRGLFMVRTEVRSKLADSHLGHLFDDGPKPTGMRYCINSASLRFVAVDRLEAEGYGKFVSQFQQGQKVSAAASEKSTKSTDEVATMAGGCFWGVEEILRQIPGVKNTETGYAGGESKSAMYEQVKTGRTGHAEAVQITFDPTKLSYEELLTYFFRLHDPTTMNRQGNDVGTQYRSVIFYHNDEQKLVAQVLIKKLSELKKWHAPIVTAVEPVTDFYRAEEYHQDYLQKHPDGYTCHYLRPL